MEDFFIQLSDTETIWGLFFRGMALMYFIAIAQLYHQVLPLGGSNGISPVSQKLSLIARDYPSWRKYLYFPTLLWINSSDKFIRGLIVAGSVSALIAFYGGPYSGYALFFCWMVYLSLDLIAGLSYPWDALLMEAGFLTLFLPQASELPSVALVAEPDPLTAFMFRFLIFRLLLGFGKMKFWKANLKDSGYFKAFMVNIPLPGYAAWFMYRFPPWFFQAVLLFSFVVEMIVPFLIFTDLRIIAAIGVVILMIGIQFVSNFGFFNLLTIVLCIPLIHTQASVFDMQLVHVNEPLEIVTAVIMAIVLVGGFFNFFFNTWCTFTWLHWPTALNVKPKWMQSVLGFYRAIIRFRITHAYGVFPAKGTPPMRLAPVIEGSQDGINWKTYEYLYYTTTEETPPRYVAPYHPRWDHAIFYDSFGTNDANFVWSLMGSGNPYEFTHATSVDAILQRILEGNKETLKLFRSVPFTAEHPPKFVRVNLYRFEPTDSKERKATGKWWKKKFAATHLPPRSLNNDFPTTRMTQPELFHWDGIFWKRWTPTFRELEQTGKTKSVEEIYARASEGLKYDVYFFWNTFIPMLDNETRDWKKLPDTVSKLKARFSYEELLELEILWSRLSHMLAARLEPYYLGEKKPELNLGKYFFFGLYMHHIIGKGQAAYEYVLNHPEDASAFKEDYTKESAFYYYGVFWLDTLIFQSRKIRWALKVMPVQTDDILPGYVNLSEHIASLFEEFGEENWPEMICDEKTGEWTIRERERERV